MQSSRKTTGSSSTYTEKSQKTLWGGFAGSLIVTMMGAIGRDFCADPDDQEPNLSLPERAACIAGGCAGMLTTSSMALAAPIVTIPLDIGTSLFRNTNTFFHKKSGRNASKPDNKIFESSLTIIPRSQPNIHEEKKGALEIIHSKPIVS